jgi:hypothetical protein
MSIPPLYARHLDSLFAQAPGLADSWLEALLTALRDPAGHGLADVERRLIGQLLACIQDARLALARALSGHLRQGFEGASARALGHSSSAAALSGFDIDALTLVDEDQAEKDIEISRIVQLVELKLEWETRELKSFGATLLPEARWDEDATACGPSVFARAMSQTAYEQTLAREVRALWLRLAGPTLVTELQRFYAYLVQHLKAQGVQPRGYRAILTPSAGSTGAPAGPASGAAPGAGQGAAGVASGGGSPLSAEAQAALVQLASRLPLMGGAGWAAAPAPAREAPAEPAAHWRPSPSGPAHQPVDPDRGPDTQTMEEFANFRLAPMEDAPPPGPAAAPATAQAMHELLGRLFERMLADPRVEPTIRSSLAQLQGSVASLATQDPALLNSEQHPAWALINQIAAHASELPSDQEGRGQAFARFVQPLTNRLAHGQATRGAYEQALFEVNDFIADEEAEQLEATASTRQALSETEEKARLLPLLKQQVEEQLRRASSVSLVLETFLLGPWVEVLAQVMASQGADSPESQALVGTVDDLLASLHRPETDAERRAMRARLPRLIERVQRGMALIDLPQPHRERVLADLMRTHRGLLVERPVETPEPPQPAAPEPTPTPAAAEPSAPESDTPTEPPELEAQPSWLHDSHLGGLPTVPMGLGSEADKGPSAWLNQLHRGQRCKLHLQGQWTTATLLWASDNGQFFMFSSKLAGGVHSLTRRGLERLRTEGLATELVEMSLVQRAVSGVLQELGQTPPTASRNRR